MSNYEKLYKFIDPRKLPLDYQELIRIVGLKKTLEIADRVGGTYIYMEKTDKALLPAKRAYILHHVSSATDEAVNIRQIARDTGLSMETVYKVLRERNKPDSGKSGKGDQELETTSQDHLNEKGDKNDAEQ